MAKIIWFHPNSYKKNENQPILLHIAHTQDLNCIQTGFHEKIWLYPTKTFRNIPLEFRMMQMSERGFSMHSPIHYNKYINHSPFFCKDITYCRIQPVFGGGSHDWRPSSHCKDCSTGGNICNIGTSAGTTNIRIF